MRGQKRDRETVLIYAVAVVTLLGTSTIILGLLSSEADRAETWAAGAGWFTAAVTLYAAALVRDTLVTTRGALAEAGRATTAAEGAIREQKRIGEAQVRAYLSAPKVTMFVPIAVGDDGIEGFPEGVPGLFGAAVHVTNYGQSPAIAVRVAGGNLRVSYPNERTCWYEAWAYHPNLQLNDGRPRTVASGETEETMTVFRFTSAGQREANVEAVQVGGSVVLVWEDVFGTTWELTAHIDARVERPTKDDRSFEMILRNGAQTVSRAPSLETLERDAEEFLERVKAGEFEPEPGEDSGRSARPWRSSSRSRRLRRRRSSWPRRGCGSRGTCEAWR